MKATISRLELSMEELQKLVEHARTEPLSDEEYGQLKAAIETLGYLTQLVEDKDTTIQRLRQILFGAKTEKTNKVLNQEVDKQEKPEPAVPGGDAREASADDASEGSDPKRKRKGHGRNGARAYAGAQKVQVSHASLKRGERCPKCTKGKLYELNTPAVLVRVTGQVPLAATVYELQQLRCNLCGEVYRAEAPEGVGAEKYDERAVSMVALLKYGSGVPFNRLERLQSNLEVPLPASTQWEMVEEKAQVLAPVYEELIRQAAQGEVLYNDDTKMRILALMGKSPPERETAKAGTDTEGDEIDTDRTGVFTSGIVSTREGRKIALYFTGRKHAGENLAAVLAHRAAELGPPIQMCDALAANVSEDLQVIVANCNLHGRRKFVEVAHNFPEECRYVLETFRELYRNEAHCRKERMTPEERLAFHQAQSGPLMTGLKEWMDQQFAERKVEPNSGLGKAIQYMQNHWTKLTLFLSKAGAPLDSNLVERTLKKAILHRKNALFYKTENGAAVGDLFMSLIYTCELHGVNAFDYLTELQQHAGELSRNHQAWMPWNYREALQRASAA
jgi:transposase